VTVAGSSTWAMGPGGEAVLHHRWFDPGTADGPDGLFRRSTRAGPAEAGGPPAPVRSPQAQRQEQSHSGGQDPPGW
ncbi:MAG: hypothetical protein QOJ30_4267, partial [Pseudonocardiales bacterium]|nr:hypothetical protein [Pseudonocardiales bacterium]